MTRRIMTGPRWAAVVAAILLIGGAVYWFAPQTLLYDVTVDETVPTIEPEERDDGEDDPEPDGPSVVAEGEFVTQEHETTGTAQLIRNADGTHQIVFHGLDTSNGPDLRVWLTDQAVDPNEWFVFDDGYHAELGELKGNKGDQAYPVPDSVDLDKVSSVSIWCVRFGVSFGAATLVADA